MIASSIIHISKILISKFDTQITKWLIKKIKKSPQSFENQLLRIEIVQKSYLCCQI